MEEVNEDIDHVDRLQKGDVEAFDLIYSKYSSIIYSFSLKYLRSTTDAEELVQSVFVKLWETRKKLKKELSFKSYLFTIAYNDICKLIRKKNYYLKYLNHLYKENPNSSFEIEDEINNRMVLKKIEQIINRLPEKHRMILLKRRNEENSSKEIAAEMGLTPGTVDNYLSEAIRFIRDRIKRIDIV